MKERTKKSGLDIFSQEEGNYEKKMDAYVLTGKNKGDKLDNRKEEISRILSRNSAHFT